MFQVKIGSYQDRNVPILIATSVLLVPHRPGIANDIKLVSDPGFPTGGGAHVRRGGVTLFLLSYFKNSPVDLSHVFKCQKVPKRNYQICQLYVICQKVQQRNYGRGS